MISRELSEERVSEHEVQVDINQENVNEKQNEPELSQNKMSKYEMHEQFI